ncbi:hypothetical protein SAMN05216359_102145 [Roseateles sp. YR242]|uniref:hypothetical protein n=1 Tax=Roseateles sp. YR242 TaxID=1855305 RepID=UPI0008BB8085|nr:hypothetical protein [Roseateles sp. YR242]SEK54228.1 hypothetical protein SAMN05216359_102145 [Roseateles sp. YR242]
MDDDGLAEEARTKRLEQHNHAHIRQQAQQLRTAPDELGQLTGAVLVNDYAAIVQLAQGTTNPLVYGLALRACPRSQLPACDHLSAQRWIQLDPSNATAWWALAAAAKDRASAIQALQGAAAATHVIPLKNQLLKRAAMLMDSGPEQLLPIAVTTIGIDSADRFDAAAGLWTACGKTAPTDPALGAACQGFALDAVRMEPSALGKLGATVHAERMGAKPEQLPRTRGELKAIVEAINEWRTPGFSASNGDLPCEMARTMMAFDLASADEGDVAVFERRQQGQTANPKR